MNSTSPYPRSRQLAFAGMATETTIAEVAFLALAEEWACAVAQSPVDRALPREADELAWFAFPWLDPAQALP